MSQELESLPDAEDDFVDETETEKLAETAEYPGGRRNLLGLYIQSIGQFKLLGREEQLALAQRIKRAKKRCAWRIHKVANAPLCRKSRHKIRPEYAEGCDCRSCTVTKYVRDKGEAPTMETIEAVLADHTDLLGLFGKKTDVEDFDRFFQANLRLVISVARKYGSKSSLGLLDRIQYGNVGLAKAIIKFDPGLGNQFSTYAIWWIRQGITRSVEDKGRTIRHPVHFIQRQAKIADVQRKHMAQHGQMPTPAQIGEKTGLNAEEVAKHQGLYSAEPVSLSTPIFTGASGTSAESTLSDYVAATNVVDPLQEIDRTETMKIVRRCIRELPERMQLILRLRFGFNERLEEADGDMTLEEVGDKLDLTRERIRQVQNEALNALQKKLRRNGVDGIPL